MELIIFLHYRFFAIKNMANTPSIAPTANVPINIGMLVLIGLLGAGVEVGVGVATGVGVGVGVGDAALSRMNVPLSPDGVNFNDACPVLISGVTFCPWKFAPSNLTR